MSGTTADRAGILAWVTRHIDAGLALFLGVLSLATMLAIPASIGTMPPPLAVIVSVTAAAAIGVRRRWPVWVLVVVGTAILIEQGYGTSLNFSAPALLIALFTVAAETSRRTSLPILVILPLYLIGADLLFGAVQGTTTATLIAQYVSATGVFAVAWLAGDSVRARHARTAELEERAARLEAQQAEAARIAVQNERAMIARELHDIVAHSVGVMVVQAGAARRILDEQPEEARTAIAAIESTGREALTEMRRLLGVLRSGEPAAPLEPQQGLAGLGALIANASRGGVAVELVIDGEPRTLPAGLDLAAYRIVQEALTNTVKHAAPARATIRVRYEPDAIELDIRDDGARAQVADRQLPGHGLVGMEERVRLFGGTFRAGPDAPSGFRIAARLPIGAPAG